MVAYSEPVKFLLTLLFRTFTISAVCVVVEVDALAATVLLILIFWLLLILMF